MRIFFSAALAVCLAAPLAAGEHSGRRAPGFALPDVNYNYHDLYDYRGKLVILEIMQTACPVCQTFQKILDRIRVKYGDKVAILTIVNPPDTVDTVKKFINDHNVKTPMVFDMGQATASYLRLTPKNPTITLPHLFLIDGNGMIRNDYEYKAGTEAIFENGQPLMLEIDSILADMAKGKAAPPTAAPKPAAPKAPAKKAAAKS